MEHVYLRRQAIVDEKEDLFAYEILYRDCNKKSDITDERYASGSVINNVLNEFGTEALLGNHRAFVKIDQKFLMNDIIFSVPKEFFIFSLLDSIEMDERVAERVRQLFEEEYIFSINDTSLTKEHLQKYKPIFKELSYFKVNFQEGVDRYTKELISELKSYTIQVVGTRIDERSYYNLAKYSGCNLFQGYFLAKPTIMKNAKYDPLQLNILEHLHICYEVKDSLLKNKGILGELYLLACEIESFNTQAIADFALKYKVEPIVIKALILESIESVNSFEHSLKS